MKKLVLCLSVLAVACAGESTDDGDHAERLALEGAEIVDFLGDDRVSDPIELADGFERVGLFWDATAAGALELRTSDDGVTWGAWSAPEVVHVERIAYVGHVDAPGGASFVQVRVPAGAPTPTFLVIEGLPEIPEPFDPEAKIDYVDTTSSYDTRWTPIGSVRIYSRADWGARAPRCSSPSMTPYRATIHHTVTPTSDSLTPQERLRNIQSYHMYTNGWCDIGYNYAVSRDGRVWRLRGPTTLGAHVANNNSGNIGIVYIGTYTSTTPTSTQMCEGAKLLRRLSMDFDAVDLNRTDIKGHRQLGQTACPGDALYARLDALVRKANGGCGVN